MYGVIVRKDVKGMEQDFKCTKNVGFSEDQTALCDAAKEIQEDLDNTLQVISILKNVDRGGAL